MAPQGYGGYPQNAAQAYYVRLRFAACRRAPISADLASLLVLLRPSKPPTPNRCNRPSSSRPLPLARPPLLRLRTALRRKLPPRALLLLPVSVPMRLLALLRALLLPGATTRRRRTGSTGKDSQTAREYFRR